MPHCLSSLLSFPPSRPRSSTIRRIAAAALGALCVATGGTAFAHAHLSSSEPAANATLAASAAPAGLTLHFTEPLEPAFSKVVIADAAGSAVTRAAAKIDDHDPKTLHLALPTLAAGRYVVHWTAVATDGHRTQGDFSFTVR